ncbi:vp91/p95 [Cryptophlebia peltastica nucleopolyhedrovirus]|uniref:Vp91/p95 n=1 Tax=Cryptophlebia peltastica nucleopolyhedrovirus TaxID=2304025 RepID=A0A346RNT5_9ABAC|nr:vp91/p95 [Cryptophlebia peltastica nucleopolyhedrovirus]AXS67732.1 vp91/p95 [Cryptophlebia peltastica nucleopolyhedrovirus]
MFSILYLILYNDFNENEFNKRLSVLLEYMRRTNSELPTPEQLSYVSHVDQNFYTITQFSTSDLNITKQTLHDDRIEIFDFLSQKFQPIQHNEEARVKAHSKYHSKFMVRGDDGWMDVDCPLNEIFDESIMRCVPTPICDQKLPGNYGLTENMIDKLVLNHAIIRENVDENLFHPTMYLQCFDGGSHAVMECPNDHIFNATTKVCELINECENRPDDFILTRFPDYLNINEYMICKNGETKIVSCPNGKIFDRNQLKCVLGNACEINGVGFTYITDEIGDSQFFKCINESEAELVTCINRIFRNDQYECTGDVQCANFVNGSGTQIKMFEDDTWMFANGILICENFQVQKNIDCDSTNLLQDKLFNEKFKVNLNIPAEIFDTDSGMCVPFTKNLIKIKNEIFPIENINNDYNINFETAMVGRTDAVETLLETSSLESCVSLARDIGAVGINPLNGDSINCFGENLYDIFTGDKLNICDDNQLVKSVDLNYDFYFQPKTSKVGRDDDYERFCGQKTTNAQKIVENDLFSARIFAHILRSDVCGLLMAQIYHSYTTMNRKYTTIYVQYTYDIEKSPKNIVVYESNIQNKNATMQKRGSTANDIFVNREIVDGENDVIKPLFDPFERSEIQPIFNPFDVAIRPPLSWFPESEPDIEPEPEPEPEPVPELILADKLLDYSCFYSLPTYKFSECEIANDFIVDKIKELRNNITVDPECENARGLSNVFNSYVYLGNGIGCKCRYDDEKGIIVEKILDGPRYLNVETQSNDGVKYNQWVHKNGNTFIACPQELLNDNFDCAVHSDKFYYLEDLHE